MDRNEQLKILNLSVSQWNLWRRKNKLSRPNFSGADLSGVDLTGANLCHVNLHGANFTRANLSQANFSRANLRNATFREANLSQANFTDADLSFTIFIYSSFWKTDLTRTTLNSASLGYATLREVILNDANLIDTRFWESALLDVNLSVANNLEKIFHLGASSVDQRTIEKSWPLPLVFLRGIGLSEQLINYYQSMMSPPIDFYSCFISYSHADKEFAHRLHAELQNRGIRCWLDEHQMLPGDDIYEKIQEGVKLWDKVLLCCSEESLTSWWVDNEIDSAFDKERQLMKSRGEKVLALIPLDIDGFMFSEDWNSGKKEQIKARIAGNFQEWRGDFDLFESEFGKLIKALRVDSGGREAPPISKL